MTPMQPGTTRDITAIPRAVISAAVGVVHTVERAVGAGPIRTARDNAWEAVCADLDRARQREEIRRFVAARSAQPGRSVGSSPRSSAAHASPVASPVSRSGPRAAGSTAPGGRRS
jgi:hypothetical protein